MSQRIKRYYQEELYQLRQLATEFSGRYPALAPMLGNPSSDPDVERLLEGVAYLTGILRSKLDDELPEVIHGLLQMAFPHYLRPIPACTLLQFQPLPGLLEGLTIPAGTQVASRPVEDTRCQFKTTSEVILWPLQLVNVQYLEEGGGNSVCIRLHLKLEGLSLPRWKADTLRFYLSGPFNRATDIYYLLSRQLKTLRLHTGKPDQAFSLSPEHLQFTGFSADQPLIPFPDQAFPGYRLLQEFFLMPQKFLFFDIRGLDQWSDRPVQDVFYIDCVLKQNYARAERIGREDFQLFTVPACNLFEQDGTPINLDHRHTGYRVLPMNQNPEHYQVHSISQVEGIRKGNLEKRLYQAFEQFQYVRNGGPVYSQQLRPGRTGRSMAMLLSVTLPPDEKIQEEVLSLKLLCTNGTLPERLNRGDICEPTSNTPGRCRFSNLLPPTPQVLPALGEELLWTFQSLMTLNLASLARKESLQELLGLHVQCTTRQPELQQAHERRIEGIVAVEAQPAQRLLQGIPISGYRINVDLDSNHFSCFGDMFLFTHVLDHLFASYLPVNSFCQLKLRIRPSGEEFLWTARTGDRQLL